MLDAQETIREVMRTMLLLGQTNNQRIIRKSSLKSNSLF